MSQKRVLTIQDYSCLGRCSLTVALPTLSVCGVEAVGLPTALFSNHTAFPKWTCLDLTNEMLPIVDQWLSYRHDFDYLYTGYLTENQVSVVLTIIAKLKEAKTKFIIDPAMADDGTLYPGFSERHVASMKQLIKGADLVLPNLTEACLLTDTPYPEHADVAFYHLLIEKLLTLPVKAVCLTGISLTSGKVGLMLKQQGKDGYFVYETPSLPGSYHGTGDLFASSLVGVLANDIPLEKALIISHDFVHEAIFNTIQEGSDGKRYGPCFEPVLYRLGEAIQKERKKLRL